MDRPQPYAALLRGINVGGRNKLPMRELQELFRSLGHDDAETFIQSGNVVFNAAGNEASLASAIEAAIAERFSLQIRVLLRTHGELIEVAAQNPFSATDPAKRHVLFLERRPGKAEAASLDPDRSPGDEFRLEGREIYLSFPHGSGRTKLTLEWFERCLCTAGTARNWNTLLRLVELTGRRAGG
jgi:uncharacterized protein (DUF1697 family)